MVTGSSRAAIALAIAAGVAALITGCSRPLKAAELQAMFAEAERLCLDEKYADAKAQLKAYLMLDPLHPGAHFYLARTYFSSFDIREMGLAENEYQTALKLFERRGRESGIERFDARYFELMCNVDAAKALYVQADIISQDRSFTDVALDSLARAQTYLERARLVNPNAAEISVVEESLRDLAARLNRRRP